MLEPAMPSQADGALRRRLAGCIDCHDDHPCIDDLISVFQKELSPLRELAGQLAKRVLARHNDPQGVYETEELAKQLAAALDRMGL